MKTSINHLLSDDSAIATAKVGDIHKGNSFLTQKIPQWMRRCSGGLALSLCSCLLATSQAVAASFSLTKIADNRDFTSLTTRAVINDSGKLVFIATPPAGVQGVYTSTGEQATEIINLNSFPSLYGVPPIVIITASLSSPRINNNDTVAFITNYSGGISSDTRLVLSQGGSFATVAQGTSNRLGSETILGFDLNDRDEVAYITNFAVTMGSQGTRLTLSRPGQPSVNVATAYSSFPGILPEGSFYSINGFDLNNQGVVTFAATRFQENPPSRQPGTSAIFTLRGSSLTTIIEGESRFNVNDRGDILVLGSNTLSLFDSASNTLRTIADTSGEFSSFGFGNINNNGRVAFAAFSNQGNEGIFVVSDSSVDRVITTGDALLGSTVTDLTFFRFNNLDQIAFFAQLADGTTGIFRTENIVGANPIIDKVIATGDPLLGSTVTNLTYSGLNNNGQIAFFAQLADGNQAIFRAEPVTEQSPKSIPEGASTFALVAFAVGLGISKQRERTKKPGNFYETGFLIGICNLI